MKKNLMYFSLAAVLCVFGLTGCKNSDPSTPDGVVRFAGYSAVNNDEPGFLNSLTGRALQKYGNKDGMIAIQKLFSNPKAVKIGKPATVHTDIIQHETRHPDDKTTVVIDVRDVTYAVPVTLNNSPVQVSVFCRHKQRTESSESSSSSQGSNGSGSVSISASYSVSGTSDCKIENIEL